MGQIFIRLLRALWIFRKSIVIVLTPIILSPLLIVSETQASKCGYVIGIMSIYWIAEACPIAVTSIVPLVLFPVLGLQPPDMVSGMYFRHVMGTVIGTMIVCTAIEECGMHRRVALRILMLFSSKPSVILLGIMVTTGFISMWLGNFATSALMFPIGIAIGDQICDIHRMTQMTAVKETDEEETFSKENGQVEVADDSSALNETLEKEISDESNNMEKAVVIAICYSATIGGVCTLYGTAANFVSVGIFNTIFGEYAISSIDFGSWMAFAFPIAVLSLFFAWIWILIRFLSLRELCSTKEDRRIHNFIKSKYNELPAMGFREVAVSCHFVLLVMLWLSRNPNFTPGWIDIFPHRYPKDSTTSMAIGLSIFIFPSNLPSLSWIWRSQKSGENFSIKTSPPLLTWKKFQQKFPWDLFMLIGAGFSISSSCETSGLSKYIGDFLKSNLEAADPWVIALVISLACSILTEFTSNTATVTILLPIVLTMARNMQIHPTMIFMATTISCSFAFSLPIATPVNTLAFSVGKLRINDMLLTGIPLNFISVGILNAFLHTSGKAIFGFDTMPDWALVNITEHKPNSTL